MTAVEAEYEGGVLRPVKPLRLKPGERVRLIVLRRPDPTRWDLDRLARGNAEDSELAAEGIQEWSDSLDREDGR
jgi:predicted DNA-binding antitoxin AbrB/MazE fold protein